MLVGAELCIFVKLVSVFIGQAEVDTQGLVFDVELIAKANAVTLIEKVVLLTRLQSARECFSILRKLSITGHLQAVTYLRIVAERQLASAVIYPQPVGLATFVKNKVLIEGGCGVVTEFN